jgi:hypothetical protein
MTSVDALPDDALSLKQLLLARTEELLAARAQVASGEALIACPSSDNLRQIGSISTSRPWLTGWGRRRRR